MVAGFELLVDLAVHFSNRTLSDLSVLSDLIC